MNKTPKLKKPFASTEFCEANNASSPMLAEPLCRTIEQDDILLQQEYVCKDLKPVVGYDYDKSKMLQATYELDDMLSFISERLVTESRKVGIINRKNK